ncbi:hypothetical protein FRB94_012449 [Tulasnella sp. JGI-2019a]|nr:hypothetical protein FRB94_012449 [Tulasnella sp. JGI-2019a]
MKPICAATWEAAKSSEVVRPPLQRYHSSDTPSDSSSRSIELISFVPSTPKLVEPTMIAFAPLVTMDNVAEIEPPLGEIYLPGKPIVSHNHRALERFQKWERDNRPYIGRMSTRQRWDLYISDRDLNAFKKATASSNTPLTPNQPPHTTTALVQ